MNANMRSNPTSRASQVNDPVDNFFTDGIKAHVTERSLSSEINIPYRRFGYKCWYNLRIFFSSPIIPENDLDLMDQVKNLLQIDKSNDPETISKCEQFIKLHRNLENTSARKRLERWAKWVISLYLVVVLILLVLSSVEPQKWLDIDNEVMMVLLSTTTINIIGLGLIVLRGHFQEKETLKNKNEEKSNIIKDIEDLIAKLKN